MPDIGFIAWLDMVNFVQRLRVASHRSTVASQVTKHPERIGASGVILEDQKRPRRCGHADGKQVLVLEEYLKKLDLVLQTREDLLVVARTNATEKIRDSAQGRGKWQPPTPTRITNDA